MPAYLVHRVDREVAVVRPNRREADVGDVLDYKRHHRIPDFLVPMYLCAQTARADVGLLSPLPMFEMYSRSARHFSCRPIPISVGRRTDESVKEAS
jgi:hypothetical protein